MVFMVRVGLSIYCPFPCGYFLIYPMCRSQLFSGLLSEGIFPCVAIYSVCPWEERGLEASHVTMLVELSSFYLRKIFIYSSLLKANFAVYIILGFFKFYFHHFKYFNSLSSCSHSFWRKLRYNSHLLHFKGKLFILPPASFKSFSLYCFSGVWIWYSLMQSFWYLFCWWSLNFWNCGLVFFIKFWNLLAIITSNIFVVVSSFGIPIVLCHIFQNHLIILE